MSRLGRAAAILTAVLVVSSMAAAPALAQSNSDGESYFDPIVTETGEPGWLSSLVMDATSEVSRLYTSVTTDSGNASRYAATTAETFNANNSTLASYASDRLNADTSHDVFAVHFHDREGNNATRYVVSTVENESYSDARMLTPSEFSETDRSVDYEVSLDWYASKNANSELDHFIMNYAEPNKNVSGTYRARMLAKYGGGITSGLWGDT
jgi:hypothetical protein